jgi:hypothetical protein
MHRAPLWQPRLVGRQCCGKAINASVTLFLMAVARNAAMWFSATAQANWHASGPAVRLDCSTAIGDFVAQFADFIARDVGDRP